MLFSRALPALVFFFFLPLALSAQQTKRLKVFIDCSNTWCDDAYIRTEINVVDFLRDRVAADVHVLVTQQSVGSGGTRYQLIFFGQHTYENLKDTLRFSTAPLATEAEIREQLVQHLGFGLVPYLVKCGTPACMKISLKQSADDTAAAAPATNDPWNYWVFNLGADGNLNADQVYKSYSLSGSFSANRVTDRLKTTFSGYYTQNASIYTYLIEDSTYEFRNNNDSYNLFHLLVKSMGPHWSYGYSLNYFHSTFSNFQHQVGLGPALEYSIFPYSEVNNRFFTIRYGLGARYNAYIDTTIYDKRQELLYTQGLVTNMTFNQKWGAFSFGASFTHFLHDWRLNNLNVNTNFNIRITGGLTVNLGLYGGLVHDQIYLPKEGATAEEVLTRRRALQSGYTAWGYFGIGYRFGSKLNNFVNPRFESGAY